MTEGPGGFAEPRLRRFTPYPEYRDSGVEELGDIPVHWEVKRLKNLASVRLSNVDKKSEEGQVPVRLCNYVDVYYNDCITAELWIHESNRHARPSAAIPAPDWRCPGHEGL